MNQTPRKRVTILGATGSIGRSTLDVIRAHRDRFEVVALVAGQDVAGLVELAREFQPQYVALAEGGHHQALKNEMGLTASSSWIATGAGEQAVLEAVERDTDIVIAGIAGTAGLAPSYAALKAGRRMALANKECLVCAGEVFMRTARERGVEILPIDSEHNALFQALGTHTLEDVESMTLTASGGPFRTWTLEALKDVTIKQALSHPTWSMGAKVTIDSATLMNKGLELIEAHHLFGIEAQRLNVVVHPESIIHGLVSFKDGAVTAGMAAPDMRVAIAHALTYPHRLPVPTKRFDLVQLSKLTFETPDEVRFPCLRIAKQALAQGGVWPTVLNSANEQAVALFLEGALSFTQIAEHVEKSLMLYKGITQSPSSLSEALEIHVSVKKQREHMSHRLKVV
jgi:1-deoxy-D-xylulose-5-phosphate reductoisomerase